MYFMIVLSDDEKEQSKIVKESYYCGHLHDLIQRMLGKLAYPHIVGGVAHQMRNNTGDYIRFHNVKVKLVANQYSYEKTW